MPTYEYRCLTCDERFELRTTFADADTVRCPSGHPEVKRLLSSFGFAKAGAAVPAGAAGPAPMAGGGCCGGGCGCG